MVARQTAEYKHEENKQAGRFVVALVESALYLLHIMIGTKLAHYEITSHLGSGGMGEVYQATDSRLGRYVAIKLLPAAFASDPDRLSRFRREAQLLASLNHPNIAHIYGLEESGETRCIVMELVEGETLESRIKKGPIAIDEALGIAKQIAEALEAAHDKGIIHRDLKPGNVMLTREGRVKVLDFGLAKAYEASPGSSTLSNSPTVASMAATNAGVILGTAAYMSPEQARGKPVDKRADIWAFGVVLFEMLTGKRLFEGETIPDTLIEIATRQPNLNQVPVRVRKLLQRCLEKDPKQRLRDIGEAWFLLEEDQPATAPSATTLPPRRIRRNALVVFTALSLLALAALAFVHFREPAPAEPSRVQFDIAAPDKLTLGPYLRLSPDGRRIAFVAMSSGRGTLWVHDTSTGDSRALSPAESLDTINVSLLWSANSRFIAFPQGKKLRKVEATGGPVQTICDLPDGTFNAGAWNQDDVILFGGMPLLYRVPAAGGVAVALPSGDGQTIHSMPSFLPDGRHFIYLRDSKGSETSGIYLSSLDSKPDESPKRLLTTAWEAQYAPTADPKLGYLLFMQEGTVFAQPFDNRRLELTGSPIPVAEQAGTSGGRWAAFSASANGALAYWRGGISDPRNVQLTWKDRKGANLGVVGKPDSYRGVTLSPDSTLAALAVLTSKNPAERPIDLWLLDFSRGGAGTRFTFGGAAARFAWSPDGSRIAFASRHDGAADLYEKPVNGSRDEELLLKTGEEKIPTSWSRDGLLLFTVLDANRKNDIWVLPMGDKKPIPFLQSTFNEEEAQFSPDGRSVAYMSDKSGQYEVYVRAFTPPSASGSIIAGAEWPVSTSGGLQPRWRNDGKELYYRTLDAKVMAVEVTSSPAFHAGTPSLLFLAPRASNNGVVWDATSDGKRFLFAAQLEQSAPSPFTMVLNWQTGLKK